MASNASDTQASCLAADSPAVKRQKTASGYNSTSNSATNTKAYNSDNDDGDDLLKDYVPDTPGSAFETQPTQIIDRSVAPASSPPAPATPSRMVQVPASSPFTAPTPGRVPDKVNVGNNVGSRSVPFPSAGSSSNYVKLGQNAGSRLMQNGVAPARRPLALAMAPAGTAFRPPHGIVKQPPVINLDDSEDDGPQYIGGSSSDEEVQKRGDIEPTSFVKSPQISFNGAGSGQSPTGNARFQNIVSNAAYKAPEKGKVFTKPRTSPGSSGNGNGSKKPTQMRPERAKPIEDISLEDIPEAKIRDNIVSIRQILPRTTILTARNALIQCHLNWEDAVALLCNKEQPVVISDDEIESPQPNKPEPQMKRTLDGPVQNIRDKYSSTQALAPKKSAVATPPPKPRKRLVKGRRNPSSPAIPAISSPLKPQSPAAPSPAAQSPPAAAYDSYDSDSGMGSESEEDPELDGRVLKFLNTCKVEDLVELTNTTKAIAEVMIAARPFRNLDIARFVENTKLTKSGKKSARAPVGDRIVEAVEKMLKGYQGIDTLVKRCGELGKPLAEEMGRWGFDVFGAQKDGELEMTSLEDDVESQRDSGIGSPSSRAASHNGDDEVKVTSTRKRNVQFLKKPELMAESAVLKDYQVVGLNWLALMYRHGLSGILADEMGLGKTCQVIAFLTHLVEIGHPGPHLVVCPGSTLENWLREFRKFSPELHVEPYHGMYLRIMKRLNSD